MAVAVFDYAAWVTRYPEFSNVPEPTAQAMFDEAGLYLNNSDASPVCNVTKRLLLLGMLTAHLAALSPQYGTRSGLVGRIAGATEGSVSVQTAYDSEPGTKAWFDQTGYGAAFWTATSSLRMARYIGNPARRPWPGAT